MSLTTEDARPATPEGSVEARSEDEQEHQVPAVEDADFDGRASEHEACAVCLDGAMSHTFIPCMHTVTCSICAQRLVNEGMMRCILCRAEIEQVRAPDGSFLERHYLDGLRFRTNAQIESGRPPAWWEKMLMCILIVTYVGMLAAVPACLMYVRSRRMSHLGVELRLPLDESLGHVVLIGLILSALPWIITALLCRYQKAMGLMLLNGFFNTLLVGGMPLVAFFLLLFERFDPWMIIVFFGLAPASLMLAMCAVLGPFMALFFSVALRLMKESLPAAMCASCVLAGVGGNLNAPLLTVVYCLVWSTESCGRLEDSAAVLALSVFSFALGTWIISVIVGRVIVVFYQESENPDHDRAMTERPETPQVQV